MNSCTFARVSGSPEFSFLSTTRTPTNTSFKHIKIIVIEDLYWHGKSEGHPVRITSQLTKTDSFHVLEFTCPQIIHVHCLVDGQSTKVYRPNTLAPRTHTTICWIGIRYKFSSIGNVYSVRRYCMYTNATLSRLFSKYYFWYITSENPLSIPKKSGKCALSLAGNKVQSNFFFIPFSNDWCHNFVVVLWC